MDIHRAIEAVWRLESAKIIAGLARIVRDVGVAEDLAQSALVAALEQWPSEGIPRNPGAWLMAAAKHRAIDVLRRRTRLERKHEELAYELDRAPQPDGADLDNRLDDQLQDDMLRLIFTACMMLGTVFRSSHGPRPPAPHVQHRTHRMADGGYDARAEAEGG